MKKNNSMDGIDPQYNVKTNIESVHLDSLVVFPLYRAYLTNSGYDLSVCNINKLKLKKKRLKILKTIKILCSIENLS